MYAMPSPGKMLGKRDRVDVDAQRLCSDKLGDLTERCGWAGSVRVGRLNDHCKGDEKKGTKDEANHVLDSLGSVVTYCVPRLSSLIWSRVSLKSLPATALPPLEDEAAGVEEAGASTIGRPSRSAFSRAAFSARAFLSASI